MFQALGLHLRKRLNRSRQQFSVPHRRARVARFRITDVHILLVEDHADTRTALSKLLDQYGHEVATAENVRDALLLLENLRFDVLVSDIGLPDGNGLHLVAAAKRRQHFRQTVAVTAWDTAEDRERGRLAGFDHYLTKPLDFHKLRSVLAEAE